MNLVTLISLIVICTGLGAVEDSRTLDVVHPGLATGALRHATLGELPSGTLAVAGELTITQTDLDRKKADLPPAMATQWNQAQLLVLEDQMTSALLERAAKSAGVTGSGEDAIRAYLAGRVKDVAVTDAEVAAFHVANPDVCTAPLDQMRKDLAAYLTQGKQQDAVKTLIADLGKTQPITVNATWAAAQAAIALDNPVDHARRRGKPALIDFGANGCRPCEMMTPVLASLKTAYAGKLIVDFVHVRDNPIIASRYGIQSIPVQVIFDQAGKEVWRHTGFIPQEQLEQELAKQGVMK